MSLWSRMVNTFRGDHLNREIDEELRSHLEEAIEQGRDPGEARRAFGSQLRHREQSSDIRLLTWLDSLRADAVFGWRQLKKKKITSAAAILSLALALGACTAAFRIIDALLLRPLPVANPERLYVVAFQAVYPDGKMDVYDSCSYPMFRQWRDVVKDQAELVAVSYAERIDITYASDQEMEKAYRQYVSGSMFQKFGIEPALGRTLVESDDVKQGASPYAVLSYDYWTRRFARDPKVIGRTLRMGDVLFEIVGVAGEGFTGTETGTVTDVFVPMAMKYPRTLASANNFWLRTFVQLKPGVKPEPVHDKLSATYQAFEQERAKGFTAMPNKDRKQFFGQPMLLEPAAAGRSNLQRDYRRALEVLAILVALVLLIACANVANLMTAQAAARAREMALRVSIGAGRGRLVQLVLAESAILAFLASVIGGLFAWKAAPLIVRMINTPDNPAQLNLPADWRVFGFGLALAFIVAILFGLAPALRASSVKPAGVLRGSDDPHSRRRLMHAVVAGQAAFLVPVLFVGGLLVATFERLFHQPLGFSADRIVNVEAITYRPAPPQFWEQVEEHLRQVPGVERVAMTVWPLMSGESAVGYISIDSAPPSDAICDFLDISPGWMETMRIALLDGRDFRLNETSPGAAIVNQAFVKQYLNGANPIGKWFDRLNGSGGRSRYEIVGLVGDARSRDRLRWAIRPTAYVPLRAVDGTGAFVARGRGDFVVRTSSQNPLALASILRREVSRARPEFFVSNIRTQQEIDEAPAVRERLLAMLAMFFAVVALLLAGLGLYGVLDYSVFERRREIGIRMALGARAADVARGVTLAAFAMVLAGAGAGLALGLALVRYIAALLYGVKPTDLGMLAIPTLAVLGVSMVAALPAVIRAVRTDPAVTLRDQ